MRLRTERSEGLGTAMPVREVMVIYEDLGTALRAKNSLNLLPAGFKASTKTKMSFWRVKSLREPFLQEQAAAEAAATCAILVSLHQGASYRAEITTWLQAISEQKNLRTEILGILLDPANCDCKESADFIDTVKSLGRVAGLTVFVAMRRATIPPDEEFEPTEHQQQTRTTK